MVFYIVSWSYINLVLSAVTAITNKQSSTYVLYAILDKHIQYLDKYGMLRNNVGYIGVMSFYALFTERWLTFIKRYWNAF